MMIDMKLIQKLMDLGVRVNLSKDQWFFLRLGTRLETYKGFCLISNKAWQVTTYGTLASMISYAEENKGQQLSLSFWI